MNFARTLRAAAAMIRAASATQCRATQDVHREREAAYKVTHADLLRNFRAERGQDKPAVARMIGGGG